MAFPVTFLHFSGLYSMRERERDLGLATGSFSFRLAGDECSHAILLSVVAVSVPSVTPNGRGKPAGRFRPRCVQTVNSWNLNV